LFSILFFLSGATALSGAVCVGSQFFGASAFAASAMPAYMAGLGLAGSRRALDDRVRSPLRLYVARTAARTCRALRRRAARGRRRVHQRVCGGTGAVGLNALRALLALIVLLPPTILMGATPALADAVVRSRTSLARRSECSTAATAGAATGASLAGFVLIEALGLTPTRNSRSSSTSPWGWSHSPRRGGSPPATPRTIPRQAEPLRPAIHHPVLRGCGPRRSCSKWCGRTLILTRGTTYAFTAMLVLVLLGIACGSLAARLADRFERLHAALAGLMAAATAAVAGFCSCHAWHERSRRDRAGAVVRRAHRRRSRSGCPRWGSVRCFQSSRDIRRAEGARWASTGRAYAVNLLGASRGRMQEDSSSFIGWYGTLRVTAAVMIIAALFCGSRNGRLPSASDWSARHLGLLTSALALPPATAPLHATGSRAPSTTRGERHGECR
jgi:hypothetical protein